MSAIPLSRASSGFDGTYGLPSIVIEPSSGRSEPAITFISVLLPAPFSPMSACTSPSRSSRSTPSSATVGPNDLEMFDNLRASILFVLAARSNLVVERLRRFHAVAFVRGGDRQDADVVVVRQCQGRCTRG